jgi:general secretion pathway protein I
VQQKWWKHAEGFTLLEIMVALAIIAFAVVTYLHAQNLSIAMLNESANLTLGTFLAKNRMVTLESTNIPGPVEREGTFDEVEYVMFRWKERVVSTPLPNVLEVHVEVFWPDSRGQRSVELVSLVIRK